MCPFSILAFLQPTTVDKEPIFLAFFQVFSSFLYVLYVYLISKKIEDIHPRFHSLFDFS